MNHSLATNVPGKTLQLLENLDIAIDEARLVRKIINKHNQVRNIESTCGPSNRTQRLREEVKTLENHLLIIRSHKKQISPEKALYLVE